MPDYLAFRKAYREDLIHYGIKRRSGRYPWGSGENPYQSEGWGRKYSKGEKMDSTDKTDSSVTRRVKGDYNDLSDKEFRRKYGTTKEIYRKRVNRYGDPYMNGTLAKVGKKIGGERRKRANRDGYSYNLVRNVGKMNSKIRKIKKNLNKKSWKNLSVTDKKAIGERAIFAAMGVVGFMRIANNASVYPNLNIPLLALPVEKYVRSRVIR